MLHEFLVPLSERRVGLYYDPVFPAALNGVFLDIHGVQLELVNNWLIFRNAHDIFDVDSEEVRDS